MRNLYLGVALAPYRLDYYNYISEHMSCDIYFQIRNFDGQMFSTEDLERNCHYVPKYLDVWHVGKDRRIVRGLKQLIDAADPDFIIVPEFSFLAMQVIALKKLCRKKFKIVSQCDDSFAMLVSGGFSKFHSFSRRLCVPFLDDLLLLDNRAADWYRKRYHKGIFIPMIQNEEVLSPEEREKAIVMSGQLKNQYVLEGQKMLLFVGRLVEVKNLFRLIDACTKLEFNYKLVFVGDGVLRKQLEEYSSKKEVNTLFVGQKNGLELTAWYLCADVFVLPSTMEPFGAVTNEALLCGCNCCISEVAGSACLIEDGKNGCLCNPFESDDIARGLTKVGSMPIDMERKSKMKYGFNAVMNDLRKHLMESFS